MDYQHFDFSQEILEAPHTLIAGTTGSGKSCLINTILADFLQIYTPAHKLVLIDPKRVELSQYRGLPHVCIYADTALNAQKALANCVDCMERRYAVMQKKGQKKWNGNALFIVIDELADLLISEYGKDIKLLLQKILQLGRASGIHLICATQCPNRKVLSSEMVLNFTNRIGLRCLSPIESRQIVGVSGCEKLPQYGYCIYVSPQDGIVRMDLPNYPDKTVTEIINTTKWRYIYGF